ncbi:MAG: hypothetical protein ABIH63_04650, partial [archaeon]
MDIKFIRDDTEQKAIEELNEILEVLSSKQYSRDVYAAKKFLLALFTASKQPAPTPVKVAPFPAQHPTFVEEVSYIPSAISGEFPREFFIPMKVKARPVVKVPTPPQSQLLKAYEQARMKKIPVAKPEAPTPAPEPLVKAPEVEKKVEGIPAPPEEQVIELEEAFHDLENNYPLPVLKGRNGVAIVRNSVEKSADGMVYNVAEPVVDAKAVGYAKDLIARDIKKDPSKFDDDAFMSKHLAKALKKSKIAYSDDYADRLKYFVKRDLVGFGRVDPLLQDPNVKSVICDGVDKPVRVVFNNGLEVKSNVVFSNQDELNSFVKYLSSKFPYNPKLGPNFEGNY